MADTLKLGGTVLSAIPDMLAAQLTARYQSSSSLPDASASAYCLVVELQLTARYKGSSSVPDASASAYCLVVELLTARYHGSSSVPDARASAHSSSLPGPEL